jgi:Acyl-coenzyme A oxidase N-terminal
MWIPALMGQASEEQQQRWLPPSQRLEVSLSSVWDS